MLRLTLLLVNCAPAIVSKNRILYIRLFSFSTLLFPERDLHFACRSFQMYLIILHQVQWMRMLACIGLGRLQAAVMLRCSPVQCGRR